MSDNNVLLMMMHTEYSNTRKRIRNMRASHRGVRCVSRLCCVGSRRAGVRVSRSTRPSHGCIHSSNTRTGTRVIRFGRDGLGRRRRRDDEMAIGDSKEDLSAFSREDLVYKAKLAEQAERYATTMRCDARAM